MNEIELLNLDCKLIQAAWDFAELGHRGQSRDRVPIIPYFTHCAEVFISLVLLGKVTDETTLAAGLLHDVLEETTVSENSIKEKFGDEVLNLVKEVTRDEPNPDLLKKLSKSEIYEYRTNTLLNELANMSSKAHTIKLADRLSNLRFGRITRPKNNFQRYLSQTRKILEVIPKDSNIELFLELNREVRHCEITTQ